MSVVLDKIEVVPERVEKPRRDFDCGAFRGYETPKSWTYSLSFTVDADGRKALRDVLLSLGVDKIFVP